MNICDISGTAEPVSGDVFVIEAAFGAFLLVGALILLRWFFAQNPLRRLDDAPLRENSLPAYLPFIVVFVWLLLMGMFQAIARDYFGDDLSVENQIAKYSGLILAELLTIIVILFVASRYFEDGIAGFGLKLSNLKEDIKTGFINYIAVYPAVLFMLWLVVFLMGLFTGEEFIIPKNQSLEVIIESESIVLKALVALTAGLFVPIFEEMLFRGLVQSMAVQIVGSRWFGIVLTSILFVIMHSTSLWIHWPALMVLSLCLGYEYEKSGSLIRPIVIHILFNSVNIAAILLA